MFEGSVATPGEIAAQRKHALAVRPTVSWPLAHCATAHEGPIEP